MHPLFAPLLSLALTAAPWVSPELPLTPPGLEVSYGLQGSPAIAFDGTNALVVWQDDRYPQGIWAARVATGGTVPAPAGILIAANGASPSVAFDGTRYLVVFRVDAGNNWATVGVRVGTDGTILDPTPISISGPGSGANTAVDFDGTNFVV